MSLFEYLADKRPLILEYLKNHLDEKISSTPSEYKHLYETLRDFSLEGKLLRGCFLLFAYEMAGGKDENILVPAAAALEINQSAFLIHDDIMDDDLVRRGAPSVYAAYINNAKKQKIHKPDHYGISSGILIGDMAIFLGYELLDKTEFPSQTRQKIFAQYAKDMQYTTVGQMMDFHFSNSMHEPTEDEILEMYRYKTAQYSLVNPFVMGSYAAEASDEYIQKLFAICEKLGIIFQIKDDEIGLMGEEKVTGKKASSDVKGNKKTLIRKYLLRKAESEKNQWIKNCFGNKDLSDEDFHRLHVYVNESGVKDEIKDKLNEMAGEVLQLIDDFDVSDVHKKMLQELTHYSLTRDK